MRDVEQHRNQSADLRRFNQRRRRLSLDYDLHAATEATARCERTPWILQCVDRGAHMMRRQFLPHYFVFAPAWRIFIRRLSSERALPDLAIIGPRKSGTSDFAVTLLSHPNVLCPLVKECVSGDPLQWRPFYPTVKAVRRERARRGVALCPFISPHLHRLDIASNLARLRPEIKIIINLRNPVDVVFSEWKWAVLHTGEKTISHLPYLATFPAYVRKALEVFPAVAGPIGSTLHNGIYWTSVAHWMQCFGPANVRIFDIADYFLDRNSHFSRVEHFLGLPHVDLPSHLPVANHNPLALPKPPGETLERLKSFFEPYNRKLWELIGTSYPW